MKIICSTGGKGGVGKSTFAILLAYRLASKDKKVLLCDVDVECPNDYLITGKRLRGGESVWLAIPQIIPEKCKKCGECAKVCREHAIFIAKNGFPQIMEERCNSCGACFLVCKNQALKKEKKLVGKIFINRINKNLYLVTGMAKEGLTETTPVVNETKKKGIEIGQKLNAEYLIIDTAPGIHCNVIHALMGADKVFVVTEPTPLGAYNLERMLDLLHQISLNSGVVINRAGVGKNEEIMKIASKYGVDINLEIPYSEKLVNGYCNAKLEDFQNMVKEVDI